MNQPYQVFKDLTERPAPELVPRIILRIETLERRRQLARFTFYGALSASAAVALVPIASSLGSSVTQSGFGTYFSLFFSDSSIVLSNWQSFLISLGETFPLTQSILLLGAIALCLWGGYALYRTWKQSPSLIRLATAS